MLSPSVAQTSWPTQEGSFLSWCLCILHLTSFHCLLKGQSHSFYFQLVSDPWFTFILIYFLALQSLVDGLAVAFILSSRVACLPHYSLYLRGLSRQTREQNLSILIKHFLAYILFHHPPKEQLLLFDGLSFSFMKQIYDFIRLILESRATTTCNFCFS